MVRRAPIVHIITVSRTDHIFLFLHILNIKLLGQVPECVCVLAELQRVDHLEQVVLLLLPLLLG